MRTFAVLLVSAWFTTSCAGSGQAGEILLRNQTAQVDSDQNTSEEFVGEDENDPLEGINRGIFGFNQVVDRWVIKPVAQAYRDVLPQEAQDSVRSFLRNLRSPLILANNVLQGDIDQAGSTVGRFLVNTTLGIGGLFDVANELGMPFRDEDFGQTLGTWGVGEGFYLVLPILGPSNPRDTAGLVAEIFADPLNIYLNDQDLDYLIYVRGALAGVDLRARNIDTLDELERTSLDYYAAIRSLYRQQRANAIRNGRTEEEPVSPSVSKAAVTLPDDVVSFRK